MQEELLDDGLVVVRSTVGPESRPGRTVMYDAAMPPPEAQAWDGWPLEWAVPWSNYPETLAGRVSTVFACVDLNARTLATMPPYFAKGGNTLPSLPWLENPEPEVYAAWPEFMKQVVATMLMRGEAFVYATARYNDGYPSRFVALNPEWVTVDRGPDGIEYRLGGAVLDPADICHIKYQSYPGNLRGLSPLEGAGTNVLAALALEQYAANLASRGGIPWGVLTHPANLNAKQATDLQGAWVGAAARRDGAPAVLSGGIDLKTLTLSPKDMALLELRVFDETRIASCMGVPPFLVGLPQPSGLTYANATSLFDFHWRSCLRPLASTICTALSFWALPRGTAVELNRDEYVRPDLGERANAYAVLHGIVDPATGTSALTAEEVRALERFSNPAPSTGSMDNLSGV